MSTRHIHSAKAQLLASAIIGVCVGRHPNPPGAPPMRWWERCRG